MREKRSGASTNLRTIYSQINERSFGSLDIIIKTVRRFVGSRAPEAAASLAYYAFFSLFPFLVVLVAAASFFLEDATAQQRLLNFVTQTFPVSQQIIQNNIERVLELRGTVGIVAIIGLLWSATGFFNTLALNINRAWATADERSFLGRRSIALAIVVILFIISAASTLAIDLLPRLQIPLLGGTALYETALWKILAKLASFLFKVFMFFGLYRWIPNTVVKNLVALTGAVIAALLWDLVTSGFTWYFSSGLARYELVYGSLGTVVALLFWIYLSSLIALFGAYLTATITQPKP